MIAKMSQRMRQTNNTLKMLGMAWMSALTTTYGGHFAHTQTHTHEKDRTLKKQKQKNY